MAEANSVVPAKKGIVVTLFRLAAGSVVGLMSLAVLTLVGGIGYSWWSGTLWVDVQSTESVIVQYPYVGYMGVYTEPGAKLRLGGEVFRYPNVVDYSFSRSPNKGGSGDESLKIRFADSAHGTLSGSCNFRLPTDKETMLKIHRTYKSPEGVVHQLIRNTIENDVTMVGAMMTARQSSQEMRPELLNYIYDFLKNGVPETQTIEETTIDPVTKTEIKVKLAKVAKDKAGKNKLAAASPMKEYGVEPFGFSIDNISYEEKVEAQLAELQKIDMDVQKSILTSHKAEQDAKTADFEGKRAKTVAEWKAKEEATKSVVEAERDKTVAETKAAQQKRVAELQAEAAEFKKRELTSLGEGEAARISLVKKADLMADGGLAMRLKNQKEINEVWAKAAENRPVPRFQFSGGGGNGNAAAGDELGDYKKLMMLNAATELDKKLGGDSSVKSATTTK